MKERKIVWIFDKIEITSLRTVYEDETKSKDRCLASIDFGFFLIMDIGITLEREFDNRITWSHSFGWSEFKLNLNQIDNPYCEEVTKLVSMIKEELHEKKADIIDFLNDPSTAPKTFKVLEPKGL